MMFGSARFGAFSTFSTLQHKAVVPHVSPIKRALAKIVQDSRIAEYEEEISYKQKLCLSLWAAEMEKLWKEPDQKIMKYCVVMEKMISEARSRSNLAQEATKDEAFKLWEHEAGISLDEFECRMEKLCKKMDSAVAEFVALIKKWEREMKDFYESQFVATDEYLRKITIGTVVCANGAFIFASTRQSVKEDHGLSP